MKIIRKDGLLEPAKVSSPNGAPACCRVLQSSPERPLGHRSWGLTAREMKAEPMDVEASQACQQGRAPVSWARSGTLFKEYNS